MAGLAQAQTPYAGYGLSSAYQSCNAKAARQPNWQAAVACMEQEIQRLDKRLNAGLSKNLTQATPEQQSWLQASQNHWQQHRDAECEALKSPNTGNSVDVVTECTLLKTARRVSEVEGKRR